jgi:Photosynthesis system II assembly factor YCF48
VGVNSDGKNTDKRDAAIRNLIARRHPATLDDSCPDVDLLAAYSERTLAAGEVAYWEVHFSLCERCQEVLEALALSAPVETEEMVAANPALAATAVLEPREKLSGRKLRLWYWLAPAAGLATAAVLWFALRPTRVLPAPSVAQLAANAGRQVQPPAQPQAAADAPSALEDSKRSIGRSLAKQQSSKRMPAAPPMAAPLSAKKSAAAAGAELQSLNATVGQSIAGAVPAAAPAPPPPASPQNAQADKSFPPMRKAEARIAGSGGAIAPAQGTSGDRVQSESSLRAGTGLLPTQTSGTPSQTADGGLVRIFPENGNVIWRIGHGGKIEKSTDSETWQKQESGVTSDLLAGSAPSNDVCWISGTNGTILRTTDGGAHWTRVTSPTLEANVTPDWTSVAATDASHATVTMRDGTAFVTNDGGGTWAVVRQ